MKMTKMRALVVGCSGVAVEVAFCCGRLDGRWHHLGLLGRSLATQNNDCSKVVSHHLERQGTSYLF